MVKLKVENGYYLFKLDDILKAKNISINKLMRDTDTDFKVIKRIMSGNLMYPILYPPNTFVKKKIIKIYIPTTAQLPRFQYFDTIPCSFCHFE